MTQSTLKWFTALCVAILTVSGTAQAAPGGLVMMAKGKITVGGKAVKPKMPLNKGEKVSVAEGATLLYLTPNGQKVMVKGPATHAVGEAKPTGKPNSATTKAVALLSKGVDKMVDKDRDFKSKSGVGGVKRSGPGQGRLAIQFPLNSAIQDPTPTLRWAGSQGTYKVSLADDLGLDILSEEVEGVALKLPQDVTLEPGATYTLAVEGPAGGKSERKTSTFWLITDKEKKELSDQLNELKESFGEEKEALLTLEAALLEGMNLYHDAVHRHAELAKLDPQDTAALIQMLEDQEKMGDLVGATKTRKTLEKLAE